MLIDFAKIIILLATALLRGSHRQFPVFEENVARIACGLAY